MHFIPWTNDWIWRLRQFLRALCWQESPLLKCSWARHKNPFQLQGPLPKVGTINVMMLSAGRYSNNAAEISHLVPLECRQQLRLLVWHYSFFLFPSFSVLTEGVFISAASHLNPRCPSSLVWLWVPLPSGPYTQLGAVPTPHIWHSGRSSVQLWCCQVNKTKE